ncbi:MAG: sensor histidine kinase [Anaerolineae bacterium]
MDTLREAHKPVIDTETQIDTRMVGHDLCNSLSVIRNSVYFLNMKVGANEPKVTKHLNLIMREVTVTNRAIMNLMDALAPAVPSRAPCDANQLIRQALTQVEAPEGVEMQPMLAQQLPMVAVDGKQMTRAIENVLAYQFAGLGAGSAVRLLSRHSGTRVFVDLVDTNGSVTPAEVETLFQVNQPDKSCTLHLGLHAARVLAECNGSQLSVESRPGVGTRYSLAMPVA